MAEYSGTKLKFTARLESNNADGYIANSKHIAYEWEEKEYYTEAEAAAYNTAKGLSEGDEGFVTVTTVKGTTLSEQSVKSILDSLSDAIADASGEASAAHSVVDTTADTAALMGQPTVKETVNAVTKQKTYTLTGGLLYSVVEEDEEEEEEESES